MADNMQITLYSGFTDVARDMEGTIVERVEKAVKAGEAIPSPVLSTDEVKQYADKLYDDLKEQELQKIAQVREDVTAEQKAKQKRAERESAFHERIAAQEDRTAVYFEDSDIPTIFLRKEIKTAQQRLARLRELLPEIPPTLRFQKSPAKNELGFDSSQSIDEEPEDWLEDAEFLIRYRVYGPAKLMRKLGKQTNMKRLIVTFGAAFGTPKSNLTAAFQSLSKTHYLSTTDMHLALEATWQHRHLLKIIEKYTTWGVLPYIRLLEKHYPDDNPKLVDWTPKDPEPVSPKRGADDADHPAKRICIDVDAADDAAEKADE